MKTRRKSKAAAAAVAADEPHASSSQAREESPQLTISIPDDIDFEALSSLLPDANLSSPSPDAIVSLYRFILAQVSELDATQRELDEARAEAEKKDVELDQALQDRESQSKDLETALENAHNELTQVKQERDQLGMPLYGHSIS